MRIAFIAMSGIRVRDAELLELGLTLPGFVERSKTIASLPSLGLLTLAGMTPDHHNIKYIEMPELPADDKIEGDFDLVAISSYSAQIDEAYKLAILYKQTGTQVVMGGPHVTALPDEAIKYCSSVVVGEGEAVWIEVLADAEQKTLKLLYGVRNGDYNLADAPIPAFELLNINNYNRLTVQTSRGCPHHCEFCASSVILTDKYKQKPIENVIQEIKSILKIWEHPFIEFADDNSFVNHDYWKKLLRQLKGMNIRWFTETDLSVADDDELLELMKDAGCAQVLIGLESPTTTGLQGLEKVNNWKLNKFTEYKESIKKIQSHGITVNGCFVIGLDGHTVDIFDQVFEFVKDAELYEIQVTILTPFPGTPLYSRLQVDNRLLEEHNWQKCTLFDINFKPLNMTEDELRTGFHKLVTKLYSDEFTNWRRQKFKDNYRQQLQHKKGVSA